jgi:hypothetical protein
MSFVCALKQKETTTGLIRDSASEVPTERSARHAILSGSPHGHDPGLLNVHSSAHGLSLQYAGHTQIEHGSFAAPLFAFSLI